MFWLNIEIWEIVIFADLGHVMVHQEYDIKEVRLNKLLKI